MSDTGRSLGQVTARGATWLMAQNLSGRVVGFLSQLVIAAILSPKDFGVIGLAFTVSTFGAILSNFGVDSVLLQRQGTMRFWIVPAFWYSLGLGLTGMVVVLVAAPIAARVYHLPQVATLAAIIGIAIPITAASTVPGVLMRARFQFRAIAGLALAETLLIQGFTIGFALAHLGAYCFVLPLPIVASMRTAVIWWMTRPDLTGLMRHAGRAKYLWGSSMAVFGTGVVQSMVGQGGYIVLGIQANETIVGIYFFAFKMASQPILLMATALSNVLFPALSHLRSTPDTQQAAAIRVARLLAILVMPTAFLQAGLVEPAIHIFFHSKWDASIPLMQILSVALGFDTISWVAGTLLTAQRGFRQQFFYVLAFAPIFFVFVIIGGWNGSAPGVTLGVAGYYVLVMPLYSYAIFRTRGLSLGRLLLFYFRPAAMAGLAIWCAVAGTALVGVSNEMLRVAFIGVLGPLFYAALLRLADPDGFEEVKGLALKLLAGRVSRAAKGLT